jgi:hypothetical protein
MGIIFRVQCFDTEHDLSQEEPYSALLRETSATLFHTLIEVTFRHKWHDEVDAITSHERVKQVGDEGTLDFVGNSLFFHLGIEAHPVRYIGKAYRFDSIHLVLIVIEHGLVDGPEAAFANYVCGLEVAESHIG